LFDSEKTVFDSQNDAEEKVEDGKKKLIPKVMFCDIRSKFQFFGKLL